LAALKSIGGNAVIPHELVQGLARDAAETGTGNPEAFELSVVEAPNDCLLADLANLGRLAGRENGFHAFLSVPCRTLHPALPSPRWEGGGGVGRTSVVRPSSLPETRGDRDPP